MKKTTKILVLATIMLTAVPCDSKQETPQKDTTEQKAPKMLVLYYSLTTNTETVAKEIAQRTGADIEKIIVTEPYDTNYQATIDRCLQEREKNIIPDIQTPKVDLAQYDVIFLGFPVWFGTYAPPIAALLNQVDLSGKKVVPFCTFGSGGLDSSTKDLKERQPKAEIVPGYGVRAARLAAMPQEVDQFLKAGGFIEGEYTPLPEFSEQHTVTKEESDIFDTAVDGYPMISAKAKTVATREIPTGMEYLFTATNIPNKNNPKMPADGEIQVYVTVENGENPVFTNVIR